jgi:hypothetical protein
VTDVFPFKDPGVAWDLDGNLWVTHPPGSLCQTVGRHPAQHCTAMRREPGPFPKCPCPEHWHRVAKEGQPLEGEPLEGSAYET